MMTAKILLIERNRASLPSFAPALLKKGYEVIVHHKVDSALKEAAKSAPDLLIIDAASMRTSGTRMSRKLRDQMDGIGLLLVSPEGSKMDGASGATVTLVQPFTSRKLLNQVARMVPGDEKDLLVAGPIRLNKVQRKVRCFRKEARLTPKEAKLLTMFMKNPGKLLTRKSLIRQVWKTEYMGDTRTLDVHISWLRKAIEPDPKHPKFLKTVRGMGYRLDLPE